MPHQADQWAVHPEATKQNLGLDEVWMPEVESNAYLEKV
jgi:hypothetical protein